jgi:hypothetical protein
MLFSLLENPAEIFIGVAVEVGCYRFNRVLRSR